MLNKLYLYAGIALAGIAAYFGWKTKVRSDAKKEELARQQTEVINAAKQRKEIEQRVSTTSDDRLDEFLQPPRK